MIIIIIYLCIYRYIKKCIYLGQNRSIPYLQGEGGCPARDFSLPPPKKGQLRAAPQAASQVIEIQPQMLCEYLQWSLYIWMRLGEDFLFFFLYLFLRFLFLSSFFPSKVFPPEFTTRLPSPLGFPPPYPHPLSPSFSALFSGLLRV